MFSSLGAPAVPRSPDKAEEVDVEEDFCRHNVPGFRNLSLLTLQNTFAYLSFSELPERLLGGLPVPWQFQRREGDCSARDCPRLGLVVPPLPVAALGGVLKGKKI